MATTPRRPVNPMDAAEALFKPSKAAAAPAVERTLPNARELVSLKIDRAVLEHFQKDGPGWQDRLNETLVSALKGKLDTSSSD
jgi:uncharacterized protein (DUF4415 family)